MPGTIPTEMQPDGLPAFFHPLIRKWFTEHFSAPTDIQRRAWPRIADGEHLLLTAPTGSGKTLTAFLWALNQLATGQWPPGRTSVLYVSPLKALNNDIRRNLEAPLDQLRTAFQQAGETFPDLHVLTRSGDTPANERRRLIRHPPEILITTPESFNLLLASHSGRGILGRIETVILDEIHSVAGNKRGAYLMLAVERLVRLSGEFQRLALSATIRPLPTVAAWVGGHQLIGDAEQPRHRRRPVGCITGRQKKKYQLRIVQPAPVEIRSDPEDHWAPVVSFCQARIAANRSTLIFVNSRAVSERLTLKINALSPELIAYAHHGSLSREMRAEVERKLKAGELKAIIATHSLEMGIDIGSLDEVILLQPPRSLASTLQRLGRAGHQVGVKSKGYLVPLQAWDLVEAAALYMGIQEQAIESTTPIRCPLDVLAQVILSMTGMEEWTLDALYQQVRGCDAFHDLPRPIFDQLLAMYEGRYENSRVRELQPKLSVDRLAGTVKARPGVLRELYQAGGVIPDRGYYHLRVQDTQSRIGELDEEFVWESNPGKTFTMGTQHWRIQRITHNDVWVVPAPQSPASVPFWRAEGADREFELSARIGSFLEQANAELGQPDYGVKLQAEYGMNAGAAQTLIEFLKRQKEVTRTDLPHRRHLVIEKLARGPGPAPGNQVILHAPWGGRILRPWALALGKAWEEQLGHRVEIHVGNDCLVLVLPEDVPGQEILSLVPSSQIESLVEMALENSGFFAARFRECAGRALLLSKWRRNQRMPLWLSRLNAKKLLEKTQPFKDFPIRLETWRSCLQDDFDLKHLRELLAEVEIGTLSWSEVRTPTASPFARTVAWRQVNDYMYRPDEAPGGGTNARVDQNLIRDFVLNPGIRPQVPQSIVDQFESRRQRLAPGYAPDTTRDLLDWIKERTLIPEAEWQSLLEACRRKNPKQFPRKDSEPLLSLMREKLVRLELSHHRGWLVAARERGDEVLSALLGMAALKPLLESRRLQALRQPADPIPSSVQKSRFNGVIGSLPGDEVLSERLGGLLREWLAFYGPRTLSWISSQLGLDLDRLRPALEGLVESGEFVYGRLTQAAEVEEYCDADNFESLLRLKRAAVQVHFKPLKIDWLPVFWAGWQKLNHAGSNVEALRACLEPLLGYSSPVALWEKEILPARIPEYRIAWIDEMFLNREIGWLGTGRECVALGAASEWTLIRSPGGLSKKPVSSQTAVDITTWFSDARATYDFESLLHHSGRDSSHLTRELWDAAWRGAITNDTFASLRHGIRNQFRMDVISETSSSNRRSMRRPGIRSAISRWRGSLPLTGNWRIPWPPSPSEDLIEREEVNKDRVRLLLDRYGILFRELLKRELPCLRWNVLFRTLRLMELSGEVLGGYFFEGIPGPQFLVPGSIRLLREGLPANRIYWINAMDPNSPCGLGLEAAKGRWPARTASTHLVFRGPELVLVSQGMGKRWEVRLPPEDPDLPRCFDFISHLLHRDFEPMNCVKVETINQKSATKSKYWAVIRHQFEVVVGPSEVRIYPRRESSQSR